MTADASGSGSSRAFRPVPLWPTAVRRATGWRRAISLSEAVELDRARLTDLTTTGHRELAERFGSLTGRLRERTHAELG